MVPTRRSLTLIALLAGCCALAGPATAAPSTTYTLDLSDRHTQTLGVEARFEDVRSTTLEVHLPVWRTGLYRIVDPVGTLFDLRAADGQGEPLPVTRTAKSSWRIERKATGPGPVIVTYGLDANSLADRTRDADSDHVFVNPGPVLVYAESHRDAAVTVRAELPDGWRLATGMDQPTPGTAVAPNYDRLVDSPLEYGTHDVVGFETRGARIEIVIHGDWDGDAERLEADVGAIVRAAGDVFGDMPVSRYLFLTHSAPGLGGGTEYWNSTVVHTEPGDWHDDEDYEDILALFTHEFFHTWNVKRFRPAAIDRYDYLRENYTDLLWVAEGLTSYYDEMLLARAGLVSLARYRERLAANIDAVVDRPGYGHESLAAASFEAWTKGYHQGSDRVPTKQNRTVSFYAQGGLLGLVLDLEIRAASGGTASLDDVMRGLYRDFPLGAGGFEYDDVRSRVATAGGEALADRLDGWVLGQETLPLERVLGQVGWRLQRKPPKNDAPVPARLGLDTRWEDGAHRIRRVRKDSPAWQAGLNVGDDLIAIDDIRVPADLEDALRPHDPGARINVGFFRDGRLRSLPVVLDARLQDHEIVVDDAATEAAVRRRTDWLGGHVEQTGTGD